MQYSMRGKCMMQCHTIFKNVFYDLLLHIFLYKMPDMSQTEIQCFCSVVESCLSQSEGKCQYFMQNDLLKGIILMIKWYSNHQSINSLLVLIIGHIALAPKLSEAMRRHEILKYLEQMTKSQFYKDKKVNSLHKNNCLPFFKLNISSNLKPKLPYITFILA